MAKISDTARALNAAANLDDTEAASVAGRILNTTEVSVGTVGQLMSELDEESLREFILAVNILAADLTALPNPR